MAPELEPELEPEVPASLDPEPELEPVADAPVVPVEPELFVPVPEPLEPELPVPDPEPLAEPLDPELEPEPLDPEAEPAFEPLVADADPDCPVAPVFDPPLPEDESQPAMRIVAAIGNERRRRFIAARGYHGAGSQRLSEGWGPTPDPGNASRRHGRVHLENSFPIRRS